MTMTLKVFIGWDSREPEAYDVAEHSLRRHSSIPLDIQPLRQDDLRACGLYNRPADPLSSTEFTYTRFLTPHLAGEHGLALFFDCDFLWRADVAGLLALAADERALWCVQHDHRPVESVKMDGAVQSTYPRKNWSSLMLFNCAHPAVRALTPDIVNNQTPAFLHRMHWLDDADIGSLPVTWNWLEGWNDKPGEGTPNVIHYTRGGPWFANWQTVDYAREWLDEHELVQQTQRRAGHFVRA
jgi:hypothetical protein